MTKEELQKLAGELRIALAASRVEVERLRRWKAEALPLLTKYDEIAESVGGKLGSSKVDNLAAAVAKLRAALKPFADQANIIDHPDNQAVFGSSKDYESFRFQGLLSAITLGDMRKAAEALK